MGEPLAEQFDDFVTDNQGYLDWLELSSDDPTTVRSSVEEARLACRLLEAEIGPQSEVLEVGAGLGILSTFLSTKVARVVALEPGGTGFQSREFLGRDHPAMARVAWSTSPAESFHDKPFSLIFSLNVVEHISELEAAVANLSRLLTPGGRMVHSCPNYTMPFEPHFGVPLIPGAPGRTASLLPDSISRSDLWASLNFVTAAELRDLGSDAGLSVEFDEGVLADSLDRLVSDRDFGERHKVLHKVAKLLHPLGVVSLTRRLPAMWMTPMTVRMTAPAHPLSESPERQTSEVQQN